MTRLRIVTAPNKHTSSAESWKAWCPELPDLPAQFAPTELGAKALLEQRMAESFNDRLHTAITQLELAFQSIGVRAPNVFTWENMNNRREARSALRRMLHSTASMPDFKQPPQDRFIFLGEYLFDTGIR